jgi:ubiquitin-conjugating enzyme E2 O
MSGGGGAAAPARKVIEWFDFVTLNREGGRHGQEHEQCGVVVRRMAGNKLGVRRANGTLFAAGPGDLSVLDRSHFRRGDIVALESDRGGQIGVVTGVSTALDLVRFEDDGHGRRRARPQAVAAQEQGLIVSPESEELRRVTELVLGEYVVSGAWLGRVVEVSLDVDVVFDDGALCRLNTGAERKLVGAQAKEYDDLWSGRQTNSVLYPGQRVVRRSPSVFQESQWIRGYWKPSRVRGTVSRVGVAGVLVRWVASKHRLGTTKAPSAWQPNPQKLARFSYPTAEASAWHVGDRCFFRTPRRICHDHDHGHAAGIGVDDHDDHGRLTRRHRHGNRRTNRPSRQVHLQAESSLERPMSVAGTRTTVDVLWQDGTRQCGLPSRSLVLFRARNVYDFFPGQHVISRAAAGEQLSGIVRSLNCEDKTVHVSWLKPAATCPGPAGNSSSMAMEGETAVVSAYDLACDLDANFFYGDVVLRLQHPNPTETIIAEDDLSWVGHIVHLCCQDGHVQVKWGDGSTSKVLPHEIALVKQKRVSEMLREIGDWLYDDDDMEQEDATSAAAAHQAQPVVAIAGSDEEDSSDGDSESMKMTTMAMDRVRSVTRALIRLAGDLFAQGKRYRAAAVAEESAASPEPAAAMEDVAVEATTPMSRVDSDGSTSTSTSSTTTSVVKTGGDQPFQFPRFDVVQSPPDHHFLDSIEQVRSFLFSHYYINIDACLELHA